MSFEKKSPKTLVKFYCKLSVLLNLLTIVFSISYLLIPIESNVFSIVGFIVLCTWLVNILLLFIETHYINKTHIIGIRINRFSYAYIFIFIISIIFSILSNILVLNAVNLEGLWALMISLFIILGVSIISIFGIFFSVLISNSLEIREVWKFD
ncbi:MAG: hypothetical protein EU533_08705 [Promethearchaeota archaeon]|nr:MAG: hypothetical protein EU533_08705 [Candidatus Lokiarchaeota archaeon]